MEFDTVNLTIAGREANFYVLNCKSMPAFIIVSSESTTREVLAYSFESAFDKENIPLGALDILNEYDTQITMIKKGYAKAAVDKTEKETPLTATEKVITTANWNQSYNFWWSQCPKVNGLNTHAGCVAVAMAITMKKDGWPPSGFGSNSYTSKTYGISQSASFNTSFNWASLPLTNEKSGWNSTTQNEIAKILHLIGVSVNMDYSPTGSAAYTQDAWFAMIKNFRYDKYSNWLQRLDYSDSEWKQMLKNEINNNRVVIYDGNKDNSAHAFVCDGYNSSGYFHFNFGWGGSQNGFFSIDNISTTNGNYSLNQTAIMGLKPDKNYDGKDTYDIMFQRTYYGKKTSADSVGIKLESISNSWYINIDAFNLVNTSKNTFNGYIAPAIISKTGSIKKIITSKSLQLKSGYWYKLISFSTQLPITSDYEESDRIALFYSTDNTNWKQVYGYKESCCSFALPSQLLLHHEEQTITWNQEFNDVYAGNTYQLNASASSGLPVKYTITSGNNLARINGNTLTTISQGTITITAEQAGNENYFTAPVITKTINIKPKPACAAPTVKYDGKYITLTSSTIGAKIYYTTDGTNPSTNSSLYSSKTEMKEFCTLKAIAAKEGMANSEITEYDVSYYNDESTVYIEKPGYLKDAFEWIGVSNVKEIQIVGNINAIDINFLRTMDNLEILDMSDANIDDGNLPDDAFLGMNIIAFISPSHLSSVGNDIFKNCKRIASIVWNASINIPNSAIDDINNPNLLLYVNYLNYAPDGISNIVVNGTANKIVLSDNHEGNNNWYCPQAFMALEISYTRNFSMESGIGECKGWESISLPFRVSSITHAEKGSISPFGSWDNTPHFWLYELSNYGFVQSSKIEANTPYIVCMPNNALYNDIYNLNGDVTFSADNVYISETGQWNTATKGSKEFVPTTLKVAASRNIYALNSNQKSVTHEEGSAFISNLRDVNPFEAFIYSTGANTFFKVSENLPVVDDIIPLVRDNYDFDDNYVYGIDGKPLGKIEPKDLKPGVYLIGGKKFIKH